MKLPSLQKLFAVLALVVLIVSFGAHLAQAETTDRQVKLIVPIPGVSPDGVNAPTNPASYIKGVYQWGIGLAALLAMAQLVIGGFQYILAAGNVSSKESANERMRSAVLGLIILLSIVLILTTINPSLNNIKLREISTVRLEGELEDY